MLERIRAAIPVGTRHKLYLLVVTLGTLAVNLGLLSDAAVGHIVAIAGALLALGAGILQIVNFQVDSLASWFVNVGRAGLYAFAAVAVPAAVYFGLISTDTGAVFLAQLSTFLSSVAAIVGIIYSIPEAEVE